MTKQSLIFRNLPFFISIGSEAEKQEEKKDKKEATCVMCKQWAGTCLKGRLGRVASSPSCERFENREA
jgi:hypothetical protein